MSGVAWGLDELQGGELRLLQSMRGKGEMELRPSPTLMSASAQELSEAGTL